MAIAGRVAIVPKGEYSNAVTYDKLDLVMFNNDAYIAKKASTDIDPTNDEYWMLILNNVVAEDLENIINGTTTVGDSEKLGGKGASEYALGTDLANYVPHLKEVNYTDIDNIGKSGFYRTTIDGISLLLHIEYDINYAFQIKNPYSDSVEMQWRRKKNGVWSDWDSNMNYLPLSGGTLNEGGCIAFKSRTDGGNAVGDYFVNSDGTIFGGMGMLGYYGTGNSLYLSVSEQPYDLSTGLAITASDIKWKDKSLLHTGNKPTGTYTGNGSATTRTINVGGIGKALLLRCNELYTLIVSNSGAFGYAYDGRTLISLPYNEINFTNGVLTIATANAYVNGNSYPYKYDLI